MKRVTFLITAPLLLGALILGLASSAPAFAQTPASDGVSAAQKCYDTYNGATDHGGANAKKLTTKLLKQFKADKTCRHANGGNCTLSSTSDGQSITCTNPSASDSSDDASGNDGSSDTSGGDSQVSDPALTADCSQKSCSIFSHFINPLIQLLTILVGLAVAIGIIWGGIQVSTSAGDPQKNAAGKQHIQNAIIALIAYAILFTFLQWIVPGGVM